MSKAEVVLWKRLREANRHGYNFRRQHPVGPYIADFASLDMKLIIELDGTSHDRPDAVVHDKRRTEFLESRDYRVLRFRNDEIFGDLNRVVDVILYHVLPRNRS